MRLVLTDNPEAKMIGGNIVASLISGPTHLEIELSPHEAMRLATHLKSLARDKIAAAAQQAEIVQFSRKA